MFYSFTMMLSIVSFPLYSITFHFAGNFTVILSSDLLLKTDEYQKHEYLFWNCS